MAVTGWADPTPQRRDVNAGEPSSARPRLRALALVIALAGVAALHVALRGSGWRSSDELHDSIELLTTLLALLIAALAIMRFYARRSLSWLLAGIAFGGTAALDAAHMLAAALGASASGTDAAALMAWSWLPSRVFLPALLLLRGLLWRHTGPRHARPIFAGAAAAVLAILAVLWLAPLPPAYRPGHVVSRPQELLPALCFALALLVHLWRGAWRTSGFEMSLATSMVLGFGAQALLMPFSRTPHDAMFDGAHAVKIASMVVVLVGLLIATFRLYREAEREHQERTFGFLENIPVGVFILNAEGTPYYANAEATRLLGRGPRPGVPPEHLAPSYGAFIAGTDEPYPSERLPIVRALSGERTSVSDVEVRHGDRVVPVQIHGAPIFGPDGKIAFAVAAFQDVRELRRAALHDRLTGLANRAAFEQTFTHLAALAERSGQPFCVALIDLDRFKSVNDTYGHAVGDEVLRRVAHVVAGNLRRADVLARWGGEEFAALLPHTDEAEAGAVIERALIAMRGETFQAGGRTFHVTFSAGVARVEPGMSATDAVVLADKVLYAAKSSGRDRVCLAAS